MDKNEMEELLNEHLATWSETNPEKRKKAIQNIYREDIEVIDPFFVISGRLNLDSYICELQNKYPGYIFSVSGPSDSHHDIARLSWQFGPATKPNAITGQDIFVISESRINKLFVFLDIS